jgi:uncharacterized protein (DUF433 family)
MTLNSNELSYGNAHERSSLAYNRRATIGKGDCMFDRIVSNQAILGGKPVIKGTRISVEMVMEWIASGATRDAIVSAYPHLTAEDVEQAVGYATS